jgi:hypothetical protein
MVNAFDWVADVSMVNAVDQGADASIRQQLLHGSQQRSIAQ